jgi:hypothetical protein
MFVETAALTGAGLAVLGRSAPALREPSQRRNDVSAMNHNPMEDDAMNAEIGKSDEIVRAKIRRALLSGPNSITKEATVADMDAQGKMTVLRPGTNQWVCVPATRTSLARWICAWIPWE